MADRSYLDHASSSPVRPAVLEAMLPFLTEHFGDPGRLHHEGLTTRVAVEKAREHVADLVGARPREVVFTASGSEAVNHAIAGAMAKQRDSGRGAHVVTTKVEHSAVLEAGERAAADCTLVGVDRLGRIDPDAVVAALREDTAVVSVQTANHEVGTVQHLDDLVTRCHDRGALVHVNACASFGHDAVDFATIGADLCSITAHKVGGPTGVGALLVRRGLRVPSFVLGGAQERARRAGHENVAAIVGFGALAEQLGANDQLAVEADEQRQLVEVASHVVDTIPDVTRFGDADHSLPNLLCLGVDGVEAEPILLALDQNGIAVHSGSSCSSEMLEPSPVLEAMGVDAQHSLRVTVGWSTTHAEVERFATVLPRVVARLRALRSTG